MTKELLDYFNNDELSASVWYGKYALKNQKGEVVEQTPRDMHLRMAKELARADYPYAAYDAYHKNFEALSTLGKELAGTFSVMNQEELTNFYFGYLDRFKWIIPQGSIMSALGNFYKLQSLSNCFVVPAPLDSYGGIFKTDQEIAQLEKRRGGVGTNLNNLRPDDTPVLNAAGTSTGGHSFMDRYSNTTREVAQNGRRGALMLLMMVLHPDIFKFVTKKKDRTKVTGANISTQIVDSFMKAVVDDTDFLCKFPIDLQVELDDLDHVELPYNKLVTLDNGIFVMRIKARELYDLIVEMAWENAEPGVAFMDRVVNYSPDGVYETFKAIASNPCGEQWMQAYDACRLIAANLFSFVVNPFKKDAYLDLEKVYEVFYIQQRLSDNIVDLEIEYVDKIIKKIEADPEPEDVKAVELNLWKKVKEIATASRRTGCGFTALADMLAALGLKYDSEEALDVTKTLMQTKMRAELDCTIDLAILRGTFEGWDRAKEFRIGQATFPEGIANGRWEAPIIGGNDFYTMLLREFPDQVKRMWQYGRRNVSWSTVAPTGSLSIIAILNKYSNVSGGCEPNFLPYFFRNKKVNPSDKNVRVDFVDQNGDSWQTFPVVMGGFKEWYATVYNTDDVDEDLKFATKEDMEALFKASPYYRSCANDISWEKRIEMQGILQKYTTNAISSTLNLPKDVSKETVSDIYMAAWKAGLKGVTVYRDGCRTGVLVADNTQKANTFSYNDAPKRPKELKAELNIVTVKGNRYAVVVGFLEGKPYEVFAFNADDKVKSTKGVIIKCGKGAYDFINEKGGMIDDIQQSKHADEQMLTRLVSGMMRHGVNPKFIYQQIDKCPLEVVGFGSAIKRIIKKYISEKELIDGQNCKDCGSSNLRLQEGCVTCNDCGSSKCG
jgi:ribonucleoside-diphosphate reductase alpha chain